MDIVDDEQVVSIAGLNPLVNNTFSKDDTTAKPIKKKDVSEEDESDPTQLSRSNDSSHMQLESINLEQKAKSELAAFLSSKGVDPKAADDYKIHLGRRVKHRKGRESAGAGYSVSYSSPEGLILTSKTDVYNAVIHTLKKPKYGQASTEDNHLRAAYYQDAVDYFQVSKPELPADFGDIKVIDLGRIDTRSPFHNSVQIFPVGYKCEQLINSTSTTRGSRQTSVLCEIIDIDGDPEFLITVKSTGQTYMGTTEAEVWKKFDPSNIELNWNPSFFNLDIELLIEGMVGAMDCAKYLFHAERGYGTSYMNNEQALASKKTFLLKSGREKRNKSRQRHSQGVGDGQNDIETDNRKESSKEKNTREKEEAIKRKAEIRDSIKQQNTLKRKNELAEKEKLRQEEKEFREKLRQEERAKQQIRKDVKAEVKRSQTDASQLLLEYFDAEEDFIEQSQKSTIDIVSIQVDAESNSDLNVVIESSPDFYDFTALRQDQSKESASTLIEVCNCLYVFRHHLKLHFNPTIEEFTSFVQAIYKYQELAIAKKENSSRLTISDLHSDVAMKTEDTENEATWDTSTNMRDYDVNSDLISNCEITFDRTHLCLLHLLRESLHELLDISDGGNGESNSKKADRSVHGLILPLNELTWVELARMSMLNFIFTELGKGKEDIQGAIRGGKHTNLKATSKAIIKYIRYKMAARTMKSDTKSVKEIEIEDELKSDNEREFFYSLNNQSEDRLLSSLSYEYGRGAQLSRNPLVNVFNSEEEIIQALSSLSKSEYPDAYQRCAKVFLKIFGTAQARNLIWEVDKETYPDYYASIKYPMSLANVASSLLNRSYDSTDVSTDCYYNVCNSFYRDMRQVFLNCATFNTEATYLFIQAQKLLHVLFRHMERWSWNPSRPDLSCCDEQHCIWSYKRIENTNLKSIKCDRCLGIFSLSFIFQEESMESLAPAARKYFKLLIEPTQEQINQTHEEWYCPFCLNEDSSVHPQICKFMFNDWGTSSSIPWLFNENYSTVYSLLTTESPFILPALQSLEILTKPFKFPSIEKSLSSWSIEERLCVMSGLCRVLYNDPVGIDFLHKMASDCEKLLRISSKASFREADFMKVVREIVGDHGVSLCRSYLDGIDNREKELHNRVIEGRCVICKGSTYEEDIGPDVEVILCDGCDAEVHLHCLNLTQVPSQAWHCPTCTERLAIRESKTDHSLGNLEEFRSKDVEDELINRLVDLKTSFVDDSDVHIQTKNCGREKICMYCGMMELDLCSPFVVGQSREEHEMYVKRFQYPEASDVFASNSSCTVKFFIDGFVQEPPKLIAPYFPLLSSDDGKKLAQEISATRKEPVEVHEICALNMFQARLDRARHTLRRRRKLIGDQVVAMSGLSTIALGTDPSGRSYWKFPASDNLFIYTGVAVFPEKEQFYNLLDVKQKDFLRQPISTGAKWKVISDTNTIRNVVTLLGQSSTAQALRQNILNFILMKRDLGLESQPSSKIESRDTYDSLRHAENGDANSDEDSDKESTSSEVAAKSENRRESARTSAAADLEPVALRLLKDKGLDVLPLYEIAEEAVFEDFYAADIADDEDEVSHREYFSHSRNKYFAIAIVNNQEKKLKFSRGAVTVTYLVHREGISSALAYTPLNEQWNDNIYYFSTLNFKRSGNYTISFIVEGADFASKLEPLVFPVKVTALRIRHGPKHALDQLIASKYILSNGRQITNNRRELHALATRYQTDDVKNEFEATRIALVILYAALPSGSINYDSSPSDLSQDIFSMVANSTCWNDYLDQAWRGAVWSTQSPEILMECLLVLEYFINKGWLASPYNRLLNALALPHFAVKSATSSSVALRIFCIDRALLYDKVVVVPRSSRRTTREELAAATLSRSFSKSSRLSDSDALSKDEGRSSRPKRQSAYEMSNKTISRVSDDLPPRKRKSIRDEEETWDDNDTDSENVERPIQTGWTCNHCRVSNENRARSCNGCGERKSAIPVMDVNTNVRKTSRLRSNKKSYNEDDDEEEELNDDADDDSSEDDSDRRRKKRRSDSSKHIRSTEDDQEESEGDNEDNDVITSDIDFDQDILEFQNSSEPSASVYLRFVEILKRLYEDPRSEIFWSPVNVKAIPLYRTLIARPMDLGTILKYIRIDYYAGNHHLIAKDLRLVWENCMTFNQDGSVLYQYAQELSEIFETCYKEAFSEEERQEGTR